MSLTELERYRIDRLTESIAAMSESMTRLADVIVNTSESMARFIAMYEQALESNRKPRQTRKPAPTTYDPHFIDAWVAYPKRNGSNSKAGAFKAWHARVKQSNDHMAEIHAMFEGVERYAAWCDATNKTGTEVVMQASRFFGPQREYENAWDIPPPEVKVIRVPSELDALVKFGKKHGVATRYGESKWDYKARVENHVAQQTL